MKSSIKLGSKKTFYFSKDVFISITAFLFIILFLYTAANKLVNYGETKLQMSKSPIITDFSTILAWFVPIIEFAISFLLAYKKTMIIGLYASLSLMSIFTAYIIAILNYSETIPCSCGGILKSLDWEQHLILNCAFILLAIIAITISKK